jgi:DNA primase
MSGSGKGASGWFPLSEATVYFDHPVHAPAEHTLNVDFLNPERGPSARVAVELDPASAVALARAILAAVETAETFTGTALLGEAQVSLSRG